MLMSGLASVTFRNLLPQEIVKLVSTAGLDGIKWGGDIHVPHGNTVQAKEVRTMTHDAGLKVISYGAYYHVGEKNEDDFRSVVDVACALETQTIRIWSGRQTFRTAKQEYLQHFIEETRRIAAYAKQENKILAFEFHDRTLFDTGEAACILLREIDCPNVGTYWQVRYQESFNVCCDDLRQMLPFLVNIHAFHMDSTEQQQYELSDGSVNWKQYIKMASTSTRNHAILIEFVKDNDIDQFLRDAKTLNDLLCGK
jgi:sugar phosphate isomerase/epimerase